MEFGIALAPSPTSWQVAQRAEELGFAEVWFYDSQMLAGDCFVAMGAAALSTARIRLGTGVLVPSNRIASVAANGLATLNAMAPGRVDFGVGTGFTGRRTMGLDAIKLADMESYIRQVMGLLANDTVTMGIEGNGKRVRFLNPELGLVNTAEPVGLHISAYGPKGRALTARLGARWMTFMGNVQSALAQIEDMQRAWKAENRPLDSLFATNIGLGCVLQEGEPHDSKRAIKQAGPRALAPLHRAVDATSMGLKADGGNPDWLQDICERYVKAAAGFNPEEKDRYLVNHRGHLMFVRPEERSFITAQLIRHTCWTGTERDLIDRIGQLRDAGYKQFTIQLIPGAEAAIEDWAKIKAAFA